MLSSFGSFQGAFCTMKVIPKVGDYQVVPTLGRLGPFHLWNTSTGSSNSP